MSTNRARGNIVVGHPSLDERIDNNSGVVKLHTRAKTLDYTREC